MLTTGVTTTVVTTRITGQGHTIGADGKTTKAAAPAAFFSQVGLTSRCSAE